MGFTSFGGSDVSNTFEMPDIDMTEITGRLDRIEEAVKGINVTFAPKIEVPPAQLVAEIDLTAIENALQDLAGKNFEPLNSIHVAAPDVSIIIDFDKLRLPLLILSAPLWLLAILQAVSMFR